MIQFKLENDKCILMTSGAMVYVSENNTDVMKFYIPRQYNNIELDNCVCSLRMVLPDGTFLSLVLNKSDIYQEYLVFSTVITSDMTKVAGDISMCLSIVDQLDNAIMKTNIFFVTVYDVIGTDGMSDEQIDQLDWLTMQVEKLNDAKADNIISYDEENSIQLTSNGNPIGDKVFLPNGGSGDDVIIFGDGGSPEPTPDAYDGVIEF